MIHTRFKLVPPPTVLHGQSVEVRHDQLIYNVLSVDGQVIATGKIVEDESSPLVDAPSGFQGVIRINDE